MNVCKHSLGARSGFAICVCCKQDVALFDEKLCMLLTEGNPAAPYDPPSIHVSKLVLIETTPGSHPHQQKGFFFFIHSFANTTWHLK